MTRASTPRDADVAASASRRLAGIEPDVARALERAGRAIEKRDVAAAEAALNDARARAPRHPEVLRVAAVAALIGGRSREAIAGFREALAICPDDPLLLTNLGSALAATGDPGAAIDAFRTATRQAPTLVAAWFNLGKTLKLRGDTAAAADALTRAVELAPDHAAARVMLADARKALGRIDEAEAGYRAVLASDPRSPAAWWGLANLKTTRFDADDAAALAAAFADDNPMRDRAPIGFALAKALEDQDRYADAFDVLARANAMRREQQPWDASRFSREVDAVIAAFPTIENAGGARGAEAIFIVSLPRSGSTLVEQILSAHPAVEGTGELVDLPAVVAEESGRRVAAFPAWIAEATTVDWARLGDRYLERTARWRASRPRFTDKSLLTAPLVGAAASMLPGARFVEVRRDPVETALSCWRQWFNRGQAWSYGIEDIAAFMRDHERLMRHWRSVLPQRFHTVAYEDLVAAPEASIRALLDACGLPFDERCLAFDRSDRPVRSASAAQVRQPLRGDTGRASRYGELLDPLRHALGVG